MESLKKELEKNRNPYGLPGIFSGGMVLKTGEGVVSFLIFYIISILTYIFTGLSTIGNIDMNYKVDYGRYLFLIPLFLFVGPFIENLIFASPLERTFTHLKKYFSFFVYQLILFIITFTIIILMVFLGIGAAVVGGEVCLVIWFIILFIIIIYILYRFFAAPAYIVLSREIGGIEAIKRSWSFTKKNGEALGFFIKFIIVFFILYGISYLLNPYSLIVRAIYYSINSLINFIMIASITIFVYRYIERYSQSESTYQSF